MSIKNIPTKVLLLEYKKRKKIQESALLEYDQEFNEILLDEILKDRDTATLIYSEVTKGSGIGDATEIILNLAERSGYSDLITYEEAEELVRLVLKDFNLILEAKKKRKKRKKKEPTRNVSGNYPFGYGYGLVGGWRYWDGSERAGNGNSEQSASDGGGFFDGGGFGDGGGGGGD
jgi:uncharacterized membrane protein YgcG